MYIQVRAIPSIILKLEVSVNSTDEGGKQERREKREMRINGKGEKKGEK